MDKYTQGRQHRQVRRVRQCRQQLLEDQDLCLSQLLPQAQVEAALERHQVRFRQRLYTPLVTIWTFLYQVLAADQSCRAAVARLLALLCVKGDGSGSAKTDAYCKARQRLPESLPADLARRNGCHLHRQVPPLGLLGGRPIKMADGTTVSMPDTPANQKAYPQQPRQKQGLGFPILRMVGLISLSCGAVLDVALARYSGKRTGETSLLRRLLGRLEAEDILLADAMFSNYWTIVLLRGSARVTSVSKGHCKPWSSSPRRGARVPAEETNYTPPSSGPWPPIASTIGRIASSRARSRDAPRKDAI